MANKTVAIIGASEDRSKYGNKSVRAHLAEGYTVFPINPRCDEIEGLTCYPSLSEIPVKNLDRISVYVPPHVGIALLNDIQAAQAEEVWFNPGSESGELLQKAQELGIDIIQACSIVDIGRTPMEYDSSSG